MNDDLFSTRWVCCELGISDNGLRYKATTAGVEPIEIRRKLFYTMDQINTIKKHKGLRNNPVKNENYDDIILYWKASKENSSRHIAEKFNISEGQVNSILNRHLAGLKAKL